MNPASVSHWSTSDDWQTGDLLGVALLGESLAIVATCPEITLLRPVPRTSEAEFCAVLRRNPQMARAVITYWRGIIHLQQDKYSLLPLFLDLRHATYLNWICRTPTAFLYVMLADGDSRAAALKDWITYSGYMKPKHIEGFDECNLLRDMRDWSKDHFREVEKTFRDVRVVLQTFKENP